MRGIFKRNMGSSHRTFTGAPVDRRSRDEMKELH